MRVSSRLLHACRITLFSRDHCGPCVRAKSALSNVWDSRPFDFEEINLSKPGAKTKAWRDLYNLDVPVVHVSKSQSPEEDPKLAAEAVKLMHRFDPDDIKAKMDMVEKA